MAVSGSISIKQNSQNIANNTSSITVTGKATMSGPSYDLYTRTGTLTIDGKSYKFSATFPSNSTKTLFSKTVTITHNSVGEKTVSASFSIKTGMTGTLPNGVISESTSKKLTKIPRTSKVSMSDKNFNIGASITINTNRASSSFTHRLVIKFNGKTVRTQTNVGASYSWSTSELYQYVPNANSATGTVTCTTYSGSTNIGSSSVSFTANVKNSNPTFSNFEVEDTNTRTLALTGDETKYIRKYSSIQITIPIAEKMTTKNSATSKAYNMIVGDQNYTVAYSDTTDVVHTFNNVDANVVNVYAVDSRNNQTEASKSLDIMDYTEVLLQNVKVYRENGVGTNVIVTANGRYDNINFGTVTNSIKSIQFRKKKSELSTWDDWQSIMYLFDIDTTDGTFETNPTLLSQELTGFELGVEYDVQIKVEDELSSDTEEIQVNSGKVLMSAVKDQGVCFGGIYDTNVGGALQVGETDPIDVAGIIERFNCIIVSTENTDLNDYTETGRYFFSSEVTPTNIPYGVNGWLEVFRGSSDWVKQLWFRAGTLDTNDSDTFVRTRINGEWSEWTDISDGYNSGWITADLTSRFKAYNNNSSNTPLYRRIGKTVEIKGIVSPTSTITGSTTAITIFTLPNGFRPSQGVYSICQGTGVNKWLLTIGTSGSVNFSRYGANELNDASNTVWLPFYVIFTRD